MRVYLVLKMVRRLSPSGLSWQNIEEVDSVWNSKKQAKEYCISKNKGWTRYWVARKSYQMKGVQR